MIALAAGSCAHASPTSEAPPPASSTSDAVPAASPGVEHDRAPCVSVSEHLTKLAGDNATDCGSIARGAERSEAWSCVEAAHRAGNAFKVVLFARGKDSTLGIAWTRDASGQVTRVWSDGDRTGSTKDNLTIGTKACSQPQLREKAGGLERGELFECAPSPDPEHRCHWHAHVIQ